jgi:RNA polymerase sigma factor (sigma-70 family)
VGAISHGADLRRRGDGLEARSAAAAAAAGRPGRRKRGTEAPGRAAVRAKTDRSTPAWDVAEVVGRAADGDQLAWERLFDQYARLIWSMTRNFKLVESDAADVFQTTWLRLLEHINRLDHPARVGSWLAATARHECLRQLAARKRIVLMHDDDELAEGEPHGPEIDERLLAEESTEAVREALSHLPARWQRLLQLLMNDPPASYAEISDQLGLPVGSIGPTRGRCLERLRVLLQAS